MTKIEAAEKLKAILEEATEDEEAVCYVTSYDADALDMAIKALEQTSALDKIRAEIKKWYWQADKQALAKDPCVVDAMIDLFIRTIDKYKIESEDIE